MRKTSTVTQLVGLDLGQSADPTALVVLEKVVITHTLHKDVDPHCKVDGEVAYSSSTYNCRHLKRYPLGTPYPIMVKEVCGLFARPPMKGQRLVVDATGVGRPVVDMFRQPVALTDNDVRDWTRAWGPTWVVPPIITEPFRKGPDLLMFPIQARVVPVTITGGRGNPHHDEYGWKVPKKELVGVIQKLLGSKRLRLAKGLHNVEQITNELRAFKEKMKPDGGDSSLEAWREKDHDDVVLAMAIALWVAEKGSRQLWVR